MIANIFQAQTSVLQGYVQTGAYARISVRLSSIAPAPNSQTVPVCLCAELTTDNVLEAYDFPANLDGWAVDGILEPLRSAGAATQVRTEEEDITTRVMAVYTRRQVRKSAVCANAALSRGCSYPSYAVCGRLSPEERGS